MAQFTTVDYGYSNFTTHISTIQNTTTSASSFQYKISIAHIIQFVICSILFIVGLIANSMVLVIYLATPSLQNTTNFYLMTLMFVDLIIICFNIPVVIISDIMQDNIRYILGDAMCKLSQSIAAASVFIMSLTLAAISLDRCLAVLYPLKQRVSKSWTIFIIVCIWLISCTLAIPEMLYLKVVNFSTTISLCLRVWPDTNGKFFSNNYLTYMTCVTCVGFLLPLIIMIFTNIQIAIHVNKSGSIHGGATHCQSINNNKRHVLIMVITIVIAFIICLTPKEVVRVLAANNLLAQLPPASIKILVLVVRFIAYTNAAINPIVYAMLNKQFKKALTRMSRLSKPRCKSTARSTIL